MSAPPRRRDDQAGLPVNFMFPKLSLILNRDQAFRFVEYGALSYFLGQQFDSGVARCSALVAATDAVR
jgi:hypothetical protein